MKREKHFWKKLFCFVFLFTVVTGCGSVYAAEHGTVEEKETEDRSGMLEDELEQMEESLLDEFDFRQIDQLSGETELGEKVRFRDLTEMLISGNTKELGERFLEFFSGQVFSVFQKGRKNLARLLLITVAAAFFSNFTSIFQNRQTAEAGFYILYLVVIAICLEAYQSMNLYAEEKTGELVQLMQVFCPSFFLAVAFTGKSSSALMFYNTILFLIYLVELLVLHFLLPAVKIYGMVRVLSCLTGEDLFSEFAELLEKCIQWSMKRNRRRGWMRRARRGRVQEE